MIGQPGVLNIPDIPSDVPDVHTDARGIVAPDTGLQHFGLDRAAPSTYVGRVVDRYWLATWDLPPDQPFTQRLWPHPVVNIVVEDGRAMTGGVARRMFVRQLAGQGEGFGIMFRPAGFRALIDQPMNEMPESVAMEGALAPLGRDLEKAVVGGVGRPMTTRAAMVDELLAAAVPSDVGEVEGMAELVERIAADRSLVRVGQVAALAACGERQLQRRFADLVGLSPKAVLRRYRLFDAAEQARQLQSVDWAGLAVQLGYSDQSHLTREFTTAMGMPPATYARMCAAARRSPDSAS
ncbi:helix-turn-helix domain-containing protein [soil metagenome]